jgi:SnoaL-like domain
VIGRSDVTAWIERYEAAWRAPGVGALAELFTEDVSYRPSPWAKPLNGLDQLGEFWEAERSGPDEDFAMTSHLVAVETPVAVVGVAVRYAEPDVRWRDLWVLTFADDGRCAAFEEWPFAADQSDGHGRDPTPS